MIQESRIGSTIKSLRISRSLTLEGLSEKTGYTKGYLSKVENSKKSPPVSTLIVIAKALDVTLPRLFGEDTLPSRCSVVRRQERHVLAKSGVDFGYSFEMLAHKYPNRRMEPSILTIPGESCKSEVFQHAGEEMMLVIEGRMQFFHGGEKYILEPGDCVYFDAGIPHYGIPADRRDVKCVMVIYAP